MEMSSSSSYQNQESTPLIQRESNSVANPSVGDAKTASGGWFSGGQQLTRRTSSRDIAEDRKNRPLHTRKVPVKVEPKVFFANERTFLAWLHMALTLASISVGIVSFSSDDSSSRIYGLTMMPVSIAFCGYALMTYMRVRLTVVPLSLECALTALLFVVVLMCDD
jgi:uncharacterized membrane protein YidH (DUF202 family)